tara:strand:- start:361 stop:696 length:336 start_codon:yes stop_codon:yes gene_type:complete
MPFFGSEAEAIRVELNINTVVEMFKKILRGLTVRKFLDELDFSELGNFWKFVEELETGYNNMREDENTAGGQGFETDCSKHGLYKWAKENYMKLDSWVPVSIELEDRQGGC